MPEIESAISAVKHFRQLSDKLSAKQKAGQPATLDDACLLLGAACLLLSAQLGLSIAAKSREDDSIGR